MADDAISRRHFETTGDSYRQRLTDDGGFNTNPGQKRQTDRQTERHGGILTPAQRHLSLHILALPFLWPPEASKTLSQLCYLPFHRTLSHCLRNASSIEECVCVGGAGALQEQVDNYRNVSNLPRQTMSEGRDVNRVNISQTGGEMQIKLRKIHRAIEKE